ncbi:agamous-like MADS-box protein AGL29 [Vigna unguiculata]|uniref:MADS-box transcription factor n=1 Tax=Vigna unguiculata TaxID=3917 RepID=A0A4D6L9Q1_VIGUN|nr:agamous-like MADS-box protein AGL29 [Vigna unguiculata]QCD85242.1 MADS-box transcription factor [Vigna unguiculata]
MGRRKIEITEVKDPNTKQVTFSKRRTGLFKKANELSILCGAEVAIVVFSPGNKPYSFGHPSVDAVADKFLQQESASDVAVTPNVVEGNDSSNADNIDALNQELCGVQTQISEEHKKAIELDRRKKQQDVTKVTLNKQLQRSYLKVQRKVEDYLDAIEVSEYMLLLAKEPVIGITKQVTAKRRKN